MTVAAELPDHRPARSGRVRQYLRQLMCVAVPSLMLVVAGLFLAPPAAAHAELLETDPADGTELDQAPESVELTFNEHIEQIGAEVSITDGDGAEVTDGDPEIIGPTLTQALTAEGVAGEYTVQWRVVSADGHPISGEFTFGATEAADDSGTAATDDAADDSGTAATDDAATTEDEDAGTDEAPAEEQTGAAEAAEAVQDDGGQDGPVGEAPEEGFPWGLIFAVAAVGVALALVVRARRQLQDRPGQEPGRVDQEGDPDLKPDYPSAAGPGSGDPDTAGPDQHDQDGSIRNAGDEDPRA